MENDEQFEKALRFFKNNPDCSKALMELKPGVEILINLSGKNKCSLFYNKDELQFVNKPAKNYDVEFILKTESLRRLSEKVNLSISQIGIEVVKEALLGHIEIKKHSGIFNFLKNGYVSIIRLAGPEFLSFLATNGLGSLQKIIAFVRKM